MLFQTLVQLNILILATPALAGWSLLPPVHTGAFRTACIVWQVRAVETAAPKADMPTRQAVKLARAVPATVAPVQSVRLTALKPLYVAASTTAVVSCRPFPHAIRAP